MALLINPVHAPVQMKSFHGGKLLINTPLDTVKGKEVWKNNRTALAEKM